MKRTMILLVTVLTGLFTFGQVAVNTDASPPDASSMLDVKSTSLGMLIPRMTTAQRTAIVSPAEGLMVYDLTAGALYMFRSGTWTLSINGAMGTASQVAFWTTAGLGCDANFYWNNSTKRLGIGLTNPGQTVSVAGTFGVREGGASPVYFSVFQGGDQAANLTYTLPTAHGSGFLSNNGSGTLSWAAEADGVIGNEVTNATASGGLVRSGSGTAPSPWTLGISWGGSGTATTASRSDHNHGTAYVSGSGSATQLAFWSSGSSLSSNANLYWDNTNSRLGIGITNPAHQLEITADFMMPNTSSSTTGVMYKNNSRFLHNFTASGTNGLNTFLGLASGNFSMSGTGTQASYNTGLGNSTLSALTTGSYNTAVGTTALAGNTTGNQNTAVGRASLIGNTTGGNNTSLGSAAMYSNTLGNYNTAVGGLALYYNQTSSYNVGVGYMSLYALSFDNGGAVWLGNNTAVGTGSLQLLQPTTTGNGYGNTAVGASALDDATTGYCNTAIGYGADINPTTSSNSIVIGYNTIATGSNQVRLGNNNIQELYCQGAYAATTTSSPNLFVNSSGQISRSTASIPSGTGAAGRVTFWSGTSGLGSNANLYWDNTNSRLGIGLTNPAQQLELTGSVRMANTTNSTTGVLYKNTAPWLHNFAPAGAEGNNVFLGPNAGNFTMTLPAAGPYSSHNIGIGAYALKGLTYGYSNVGIGDSALALSAYATFNTGIGYLALAKMTEAQYNTAVGSSSLYALTTGEYNTALGSFSLKRVNTGDGNSAFGLSSGYGITTGGNNTIGGTSALYNGTSSSYNVSIGTESMYNCSGGHWNTVVGASAGYGSLSGSSYSDNTLIGAGAGGDLITGNNNIVIGSGSGRNLTTGSDNIFIGCDFSPVIQPTDKLFIGNSFLYGDLANKRFGIGASDPDGQLQVEHYGDVLVVIKADSDNNGEGDNPRLELRQDGTTVTGALGYEGVAGQTYTGTTDNALYLVNQYASSLILGTSNTTQVVIESGGNVGIGVTDPTSTLHVAGTISPDITDRNLGSPTLRWDLYANAINGDNTVVFSGLGTGTGTDLIVDGSGNVLRKSSSARYKTDFDDLEVNSSDIFNLKPVSFTWKSQGTRDFGFCAEEVAAEVPALVNYNEQGQPESVKYDQLSVLLLEELKKQQELLKSQQEEIELLKIQIRALEKK